MKEHPENHAKEICCHCYKAVALFKVEGSAPGVKVAPDKDLPELHVTHELCSPCLLDFVERSLPLASSISITPYFWFVQESQWLQTLEAQKEREEHAARLHSLSESLHDMIHPQHKDVEKTPTH